VDNFYYPLGIKANKTTVLFVVVYGCHFQHLTLKVVQMKPVHGTDNELHTTERDALDQTGTVGPSKAQGFQKIRNQVSFQNLI
jgi:hypothetical protein